MEYICIKVLTQTNKAPPYFTGSMIRGAFGYALKNVTCVNPSYNCSTCLSKNNCLYFDFYEKENEQHKYRFDITLDSKKFDFDLLLFGDACDKLPYVLSSLEAALAKNGLGKERLALKDFQIDVNGITVYTDGQFSKLPAIDTKKLQLNNFAPNVKIKLLTPLRIKQRGELVQDEIRIETILRSIYQRYKKIFYNQEEYHLDYQPNYITSAQALICKPLYRKSNRQKRSIPMDGVVGEISVVGLDQISYELLKIGEIIGAGKQTVFGLGKIKVEEVV